MIDVDRTIAVARLLITTAEGLIGAIDKAKQALEAGTAQLRSALAEIEKTRDQLTAEHEETSTNV